MRIGIDIDETICDTFEFVLPYVCKYFNLDYEVVKKQNYSYQYFEANYDYYSFAKKYYKVLVPLVPLRKGVIKYLNKIQKRGHEIIFITARSEKGYDNPYQLTYDYLVKNNVPFDTLITNASAKDEVCLDEKIDLFIDDSMQNYEDVNKVGINTYLFHNNHNKRYKGYRRLKSFRRLYKIIKKEEKNGR